MKSTSKKLLILSVLFGVLMSIPFIVNGAGWVSLFAFIPLLAMDVIAEDKKNFFPWCYLAFLVWNAISTLWICKATVGGGIFAVVANSFLMALVFSVYRLSKKRFGTFLSYVFLVCVWLAWERFYYNAEISWPWLTLGNAFAREVSLIQWYEFTGVLGGSLWILLSNILLFNVGIRALGGGWSEMNRFRRVLLPFSTAVILFAPVIFSLLVFHRYEESTEKGMDVYICQPDFDPYEKKTGLDKTTQSSIFMDLARKALENYAPKENEPALLLSPETLTNDVVVSGTYAESTTISRFKAMMKDYPNLNFILGAATREFYLSDEAPSLTVRHIRDNYWVQGRNSALMIDSTGVTGIFHKSKLVVGTELTPFPKVFNKVDDMLGGVMGRCAGQDRVTLLRARSADRMGGTTGNIGIGCAVCYESVYGEYCTGYVREGAEALAVITNDAWWGNTPGYHQHLSYSSLRAIELRRDIARCANTGISAIINQKGEIVKQSSWWEREFINGRINLNSRLTFFASHGDLVGKCATVIFLVLMACLIVIPLFRKK